MGCERLFRTDSSDVCRLAAWTRFAPTDGFSLDQPSENLPQLKTSMTPTPATAPSTPKQAEMISMAQFLVRYVTPVLKPLRFIKTGSTYRLIADNGDSRGR